MKIKKQPPKVVILWIAIASALSTILCAMNKIENDLLNIFAFIAGTFIFLYVIHLTDEKLRQRRKNAWWLIIFFGPAVVAITFSQFLSEDNDRLIIIYILLSAVFALPTAIWGVCELSANPNNEDKII